MNAIIRVLPFQSSFCVMNSMLPACSPRSAEVSRATYKVDQAWSGGWCCKLVTFNPQTATRGQIWPQPSFFFSDNFFDVSYSDTNLSWLCHDRCPVGRHSGFVLLVITGFLKISIFPLWGQIWPQVALRVLFFCIKFCAFLWW